MWWVYEVETERHHMELCQWAVEELNVGWRNTACFHYIHTPTHTHTYTHTAAHKHAHSQSHIEIYTFRLTPAVWKDEWLNDT